jgi:hypothetical protein
MWPTWRRRVRNHCLKVFDYFPFVDVEFNAAARAILPGGWLKTLVVD